MAIYFLYYGALVGIGVLLQLAGALKSNRGRAAYLILVGITLTVIGGARDFSVSYDGTTYAEVFDKFAASAWIPPQKYTFFMEYGFYVLCKLIATLGGTARTMFWITSAFVAVSVCVFIYQNTRQTLFATVILLSFPFFYSSFDLIRYYLAVSIVLLAFQCAKNGSFFPYACLIALACLFHKTAIIFLTLYFLPKIRWNGLTVLLLLGCTVAVSAFAHPLAVFFSRIFQDYTSYVYGMNQNWIGSFAGGIKTAGMYLVVACIAGFAYGNLVEKTSAQNQYLGYVAITSALSVVFVTSSIAIRLLVTMLPFMSVGLAELLQIKASKDAKLQVFLQYITVLLCVAYHSFLIMNNWQHIVPYSFGT